MPQSTPAPAPPPDPRIFFDTGPGLGETIAIVAVSLSAAWLVYKLISPLIRAWAARIEGQGGTALEQRLADLEQRIGDGERAQHRVAELEERLDFAERLLAQREEPLRVRGAGDRP
jgi:hypothetical protein